MRIKKKYFRYKNLKRLLIDILNLFLLVSIKPFVKRDSNFWLISERGFEAKDNGYFLFLWLLENHPEHKIRYVISKNSKDLVKFKEYKDKIVFWNSWKHYICLWKSQYLVSTHIVGFRPNIEMFHKIDKRFNFFKNQYKIFLQHGIIKDNLKSLYASELNLDLFICGAKKEYDYVLENFGYSDNIVKYTGLCRFDNLHNYVTKKQIVIMPTWRSYVDRSHFIESDYFNAYKSLLTNSDFHKLLESTGYKVVFYPHYEFQEKIQCFENMKLPPSITIADLSYDVQTLLKESSLMITDFSSVVFDMAYMKKPIICFQFDSNKFYRFHYKKGYFRFSDIGIICDNVQDVVFSCDRYINNSCKLEDKFLEYVNNFFILYDTNNCFRVYNEIIKLCK